jgi:hypothetical protein
MSDADAMDIRGLGYNGGHETPEPPTSDKPWTLAFGISYAHVGEGEHYSSSAGTLDGFIAEGKYKASGEHFSEAGRTKVESHELQVMGMPATNSIHTRSIRVFAGGFASGSSL